MYFIRLFIVVFCFVNVCISFPDQGQLSKTYNDIPYTLVGMHKSLYAGSTVSLSINCKPTDPAKKVDIKFGWTLRQTSCFEEYLSSDILNEEKLQMYYTCPMNTDGLSKVRYIIAKPMIMECTPAIHLDFKNLTFLPDSQGTKVPIPPGCGRNYPELTGIKIPDDMVQEEPPKSKVPDTVVIPKSNVSQSKSNASQLKPNVSQAVNAVIQEETNITAKRNRRSASDSMAKKSDDDTKAAVLQTKHNESATVLSKSVKPNLLHPSNSKIKPGSTLAVVDLDGVYLFVMKVEALNSEGINVTIDVSMKGDYGFLSAVDYPLLIFYGVMCGVYAVFAFAWLVVSATQWRDLLRIQFWIGGVIFLGLIEKAVFYAEYQSINSTGQSARAAVLFAEILSCMKRTLARMLVIIVSLGFGIVKPRLGPMLHRVVGLGAVYFILSASEGCLRVLNPKSDPNNRVLMAGVPLAVTDSAICWWIFSSLGQTIRTLKLRRNVVKLSLYCHFTNTLVFAVLASVVYIVWSIHSHKLVTCITDWKELWVDEAYWHLLFSLVLLVIMILWRPTNNNQRYAFTPLLDAVDEENEDDFDSGIANDAFDGMKMRPPKNQFNTSPRENNAKAKQDEDLKWVEENIPSSLSDTALPSLLDSDEEIMTVKFERSKME